MDMNSFKHFIYTPIMDLKTPEGEGKNGDEYTFILLIKVKSILPSEKWHKLQGGNT